MENILEPEESNGAAETPANDSSEPKADLENEQVNNPYNAKTFDDVDDDCGDDDDDDDDDDDESGDDDDDVGEDESGDDDDDVGDEAGDGFDEEEGEEGEGGGDDFGGDDDDDFDEFDDVETEEAGKNSASKTKKGTISDQKKSSNIAKGVSRFRDADGNCIEGDPDCTGNDQQAGGDNTSLYSNDAVTTQVSHLLTEWQGEAGQGGSTGDEFGFNILNNGGTISCTDVEDLGVNGSGQGITSNSATVADFHTHTSNAGPSAKDIIDLAKQATSSAYQPNQTVSYVLTPNNTLYAITIISPDKAADFYAQNSTSLSGNGWNTTTSGIGVMYQQALTSLLAQGLSSQEAYDRAIAYSLTGSGIVLTKTTMDDTTTLPTGSFLKIGLQQEFNDDGTPKKDANGNNIYTNSDCPPN